MDPENYAFTVEERRRKTRNRKIIYVASVIVAGGLLGTLLFWLINGRSFRSTSGDHLPEACPAISNAVLPDNCADIPDSEKFDCHPDRPISEKECIKRGCCYRPAYDLCVTDDDLKRSSFIGQPSCYYPKDYQGYDFNLTRFDKVIEGSLTRVIPSGFKKDVKNVSLKITLTDGNSIRIQLTDANAQRYVPDIPLNEVVGQKTPLYDVKLDTNGTLSVIRIKTGVAVFKTKLPLLVFSDQFLQLTTLTASSYLYGLGEHKDTLLRSFNWTRITLFNQGDLPVPHRNLYGTHPFYLVVEEDGSCNGLFLRNTNAMDAILQPTPAVTLRTIGGIFDFFIFLGPSPEDVVKQYLGVVGHPFMIPYWSLGFQICKYGYFSLNATNETLQRNVDAGVPLDVQWHDIDYMDDHLDFTYDPVAFNGLKEWVDELHEKGMHYVAMISPGLSNVEKSGTYPPYDEAKKLDLFVKDSSGKDIESKVWNSNYSVYPDFTNPKTGKYWTDQFKEFYKKLHFDGVWLDMNEPLNFDNGTAKGCPTSDLEDPQYLPGRPYPLRTLTICMTAKHYKTSHYNEHNLVAFRESQATYSAMVEIRNQRPFIISRATYAGQGVYSGHWSGDITSNWDDLRYTIPSMLVFNMYGMPMIGSDICGFRQNTSEELCARWHSLGAFYPFSRNHNDFDTIEQDPAKMGGIVLEAAKSALHTRYYLLPYFYYLFYRSHIYGETAVRPLFFEFPKDKIALSNQEEFLWGPALLIIPVLYEDKKEVKAYFPKTKWYDFYTGEPFKSNGESKMLSSNSTFINLFVRGGYILPLQLPDKTTTASRENAFDILIALDENEKATGEFYWDDGDSLDMEKSNLNKFSASKGSFNNTILKHKYPSKMDLNEIKIYGLSQKPSEVKINNNNTSFKFEEHSLTIAANKYSLKEELTVSWK